MSELSEHNSDITKEASNVVRVGVDCKTMYDGVLMNARVTAEYGDYYDVEIYGTGHSVTGIPKRIWRPKFSTDASTQ